MAVVGLRVTRSVTDPVASARGELAAIAQGDLTRTIVDRGSDELAQMLSTLADMQGTLRRMVGDIREGPDSINVAAREVAMGGMDLSQRTELTSSNLQQAASSLEQITSTARHSSSSAQQADQLAQSAAAVARRGGAAMEEVVSTMVEIDKSSKRISDIIGTIDGIAFQTNILALNAAVEAARAGEQGRGFAVVAGEVRQLAHRSSAAAREIKDLIVSSVVRVESGTRLVGQAGSTMPEIVASVQRVTDIIAEITSATQQQSTGIELVNQSVSELDSVTQQNAALVEESAAAAQSLSEQVQRVATAVAAFRVRDQLSSSGPSYDAPPTSGLGAAHPECTVCAQALGGSGDEAGGRTGPCPWSLRPCLCRPDNQGR